MSKVSELEELSGDGQRRVVPEEEVGNISQKNYRGMSDWELQGEQIDAQHEVVEARRQGDVQALAVAQERWESVHHECVLRDPSITRVQGRRNPSTAVLACTDSEGGVAEAERVEDAA
ncbi:hypothetical protein C8J57DRAFT_1506095 [Mycena rebaudengoi]|nr:hypothetical protein C8J57DRAFT_1506095 [Mycena rebaudengoi]